MRLYPRAGQTSLVHAGAVYAAGDDGGFDLPEHVAREVHGFCAGGRPLWETDIERQNRLMREELDRRKDPAALLSAVEQLVAAARASGDAPARQPRPRQAAAKAGG